MFRIVCLFFLFFIKFTYSQILAPEWFLEEKKSNKLYFFVRAIGETKKEAVYNAEKNIIMQLNQEYKDSFFKDNKHNTDILIPTSNIEKEEKFKGKYYILMSIQKNDLFIHEFNIFNDLNNTINQKYEFINDKNIFTKLEVFKDLEELINKAKHKIIILKNIDKDFQGEIFLKSYEEILDDFESFKNDINIKIEFVNANQAFMGEIGEILNKYISKIKFFKIDEKSNNILKIETVLKEEKFYTKFVVNLNIFFKLEFQGNIVKYDSVNIQRSSKKSFKLAKEKLKQDLEMEIFKKNIL